MHPATHFRYMLVQMKLLLLGALTLLLGSAHAQSAAVLVGAGTQTCGAWIDARANRGENAKLYETLIASWMQGFLSGLNTSGQPITLPEPATMNAYVDKWCRDHPLLDSWTAGLALIADLRQQQRKK